MEVVDDILNSKEETDSVSDSVSLNLKNLSIDFFCSKKHEYHEIFETRIMAVKQIMENNGSLVELNMRKVQLAKKLTEIKNERDQLLESSQRAGKNICPDFRWLFELEKLVDDISIEIEVYICDKNNFDKVGFSKGNFGRNSDTLSTSQFIKRPSQNYTSRLDVSEGDDFGRNFDADPGQKKR